jgi:hypothetical protein
MPPYESQRMHPNSRRLMLTKHRMPQEFWNIAATTTAMSMISLLYLSVREIVGA